MLHTPPHAAFVSGHVCLFMYVFLQVSLLLADASQQMAKMAAITGCGDVQYYDSLAGSVAAAIDALFDPTSGLFLASDVLELVRYVT